MPRNEKLPTKGRMNLFLLPATRAWLQEQALQMTRENPSFRASPSNVIDAIAKTGLTISQLTAKAQ
jgi:hypothetical protein